MLPLHWIWTTRIHPAQVSACLIVLSYKLNLKLGCWQWTNPTGACCVSLNYLTENPYQDTKQVDGDSIPVHSIGLWFRLWMILGCAYIYYSCQCKFAYLQRLSRKHSSRFCIDNLQDDRVWFHASWIMWLSLWRRGFLEWFEWRPCVRKVYLQFLQGASDHHTMWRLNGRAT